MDTIKEAHYNLGLAYLEAGQYDRAIVEFEAAIALDPNYIDAHCALARAYLGKYKALKEALDSEKEALDSGTELLDRARDAITTALAVDETYEPALDLCTEIGTGYLTAGCYLDAISQFQQALRPGEALKNRDIYVLLGITHTRLQAYPEAVEALERAIGLDPRHPDAHYYFGHIHMERADYEDAARSFESALNLSPDFKRAHYHLARAQRELGNLAGATHAIAAAIRQTPDDPETRELANELKQARYRLGLVHLGAGEYDQAVPEFEVAIVLDPNYIEAHCALARAYIEQQQLDSASDAVTAALRVEATDQAALLLCATLRQVYYETGKEHLNAGRYREAVSPFQQALRLGENLGQNPQEYDLENKFILVDLGITQVRLEAYREAAVTLQKAIALDPDLVDAHYYLGRAYGELGDYENATRYFESALGLSSNFRRAHYHLARAHRELGNLEAATNALTRALRLEPDASEIQKLANDIKLEHYNNGVICFNDDRYSEALTAFQNALQLDPDFTEAHYYSGLTYIEMENYPRAIDALEQTVALDSTHRKAYHSLAVAYFGQQELGKAKESARAALALDPGFKPAIGLLAAIDPSFTPPEAAAPEPPQTEPTPDEKPTHTVHYELGLSYRGSGMYAEAIAEFQKAIALDADFAAAHVGLGDTYLQTGELDAAAESARAALRIEPGLASGHQLLEAVGDARSQLPEEPKTQAVEQRREPAEDTAAVEPSTDPEPEVPEKSVVEQSIARGLAFLERRQYNEAAGAFRQALKTDPKSVEGHYGLARAYFEVGALDDAEAAAEDALIINPNHRGARELLQFIAAERKRERFRAVLGKIVKYVIILAVIAAVGVTIIRWIGGGPPTPPSPVTLIVSLNEPEGSADGVLNAGEQVGLILSIINSGVAVSDVKIDLDPASIHGLEFEKPEPIEKLGATRTIRIPISVDEDVRSRKESLKIQLLEKEDRNLLASEEYILDIKKR